MLNDAAAVTRGFSRGYDGAAIDRDSGKKQAVVDGPQDVIQDPADLFVGCVRVDDPTKRCCGSRLRTICTVRW